VSAFELLGDPAAAACEGDSCMIPQQPVEPGEPEATPARDGGQDGQHAAGADDA
jgi:hypothetical protein